MKHAISVLFVLTHDMLYVSSKHKILHTHIYMYIYLTYHLSIKIQPSVYRHVVCIKYTCIKCSHRRTQQTQANVNTRSLFYFSLDFTISLKDENIPYGQIVVHQYNVSGGICDTRWDNLDAKIFCQDRDYNDGAAYSHASISWWYYPSSTVYFLSLVNCTGNESRFSDCGFNSRLSLGNCSSANSAGAICYNDSGNKSVTL